MTVVRLLISDLREFKKVFYIVPKSVKNKLTEESEFFTVSVE